MLQIKKEKQKKPEYEKRNGVIGKVRKFDSDLHEKYDVEARHVIKKILGDHVYDNENVYGEDMIFADKTMPYKYLELQVFSKWSTDVFPYTYPFVYARKMKFSDKTLFLTFNKYFSELIMFGKKSISKTPSRLKKYDRECVNFVNWGRVIKLKTTELNINVIKEYAGFTINESSQPENIINENKPPVELDNNYILESKM